MKQVADEQKIEKQSVEIERLQTELKLSEKKNEQDLYELQKIVAHKIINGELNFLIRWENFDPVQSTSSMAYTWERKSDLFYCEEVLKNYMAHNNLINKI